MEKYQTIFNNICRVKPLSYASQHTKANITHSYAQNPKLIT
jgi:hypothetical protein